MPDIVVTTSFEGFVIRLNRVSWDKAKNQACLMLEE